MDYKKFSSDIAGINFQTPELARTMKRILLAHAKDEIDSRMTLLTQRINSLEKETQNSLVELKQNLKTERDVLRAQSDELETNISDNMNLSVLSEKFITEFARAFRNVNHLHRVLMNAPQSIKHHEADFIFALLGNLSDQELQMQLEELQDNSLKEIIQSATASYDNATDQEIDLRSQAQNLAQCAALVIIKRHCLACQASKSSAAPSATYTKLLETLEEKIPDVKSSTIFDNISSNQITVDAKQTTITQLLFDTKQKLGIPDQAWYSEEKIALMSPQRQLFQKLRFGQEDRRIYAEIRKKNLKNDLFMARNIYDIQQFTRDGTSESIFKETQENHYQRQKRAKITAEQAKRSNLFFQYYGKSEEFYSSADYPKSPKNQLTQDERERHNLYPRLIVYKELRELLSKPLTDYREKTTVSRIPKTTPESTLKTDPKAAETKKIKLDLLDNAYTMHNLETIFSSQKNARSNIPVPEPYFTIDAEGLITVELNYFPRLDDSVKKDKLINDMGENGRYSPRANIETKVKEFISNEGGTAVIRGKFIGKDFEEIKKQIADSKIFKDTVTNRDGTAKVLEKFAEGVKKIEAGIDKPLTEIKQLEKIYDDPIKEKNLRGLLELKAFFSHVRNEKQESVLDKEVEEHLKAQENNLNPLFSKLEECDYDVLDTQNLEKIIGDAFNWIATLPHVPQACQAIYNKAGEIAQSAKDRQDASKALNDALEPTNSKQETDICAVFRKEYGSHMAQSALDHEQSSALDDIDSMAKEYVDYAMHVDQGEFVLTPTQEEVYFDALSQIAKKINEKENQLGDLNKITFKIPHYASIDKDTPIKIEGENGSIEVKIRLKGTLPYSLSKTQDSDQFLLSYGGSRGAVAELPLTEKRRYFTNWRLYGVGQYGTVKRMDDLITGEGSIVKSGFINQPGQEPTFSELLRQDPHYRAMTSRDDDPALEFTILEAIAESKHERDPSINEQYAYSSKPGKTKQLTGGIKPTTFKMLQPLAKGMSYKDMTDAYLSEHSRGSIAYHRPPHLEEDSDHKVLQDSLALSMAIVDKADTYRKMNISHNDLKPENFMALRRPDGSYNVEFIDWATGGFSRALPPHETRDLDTLFTDLFGVEATEKADLDNGNLELTGAGGRFISQVNGVITYGVRPDLEIRHGKRNCTLPYIAPQATLGSDFSLDSACANAGVVNPEFNTQLQGDNQYAMDDWALTALTFGICNRKAYFALAHGRAVKDYAVPGVLDAVGDQLILKDAKRFNEFFSPNVDEDKLDEAHPDLNNPNAVMYIPSTQREGQPIHLDQKLRLLLPHVDEAMRTRIEAILQRVHESIAEGKGLPLPELRTQLKAATDCLHEIEQQKIAQQTLQKNETLNKVLEKFSIPFDEDKLSLEFESSGLKNIEILCTYPSTPEARAKVLAILDTLPANWFVERILKRDTLRTLIQSAIVHQQPEIVSLIINKIQGDPELFTLMKEQGLLILALQQGMTEQAQAMITASEKSNPEILDLLLAHYSRDGFTWDKNALHAAIRNNNHKQLALISQYLPQSSENPQVIAAVKEALYFSADLLKPEMFEAVLKAHSISSYDILQIRDPELQKMDSTNHTCPYHFFLSESSFNQYIPFETLASTTTTDQKSVIKNFFINSPYPLIITAENQNFEGLMKLLAIARTKSLLTSEESKNLLLQKDMNGENLLNHVLNTGNVSSIQTFIAELQQHPGMNNEVFFALLNNRAPNNPLCNFLNDSKNKTEDKYTVLTLLLTQVLNNPRTAEAQSNARNLLLANSDWIFKEVLAERQSTLHEKLWSMKNIAPETQLSLFIELEKIAADEKINRYFKEQRQQFEASHREEREITVLDFSLLDQAIVHNQKHGDSIEVLMDLLTKNDQRYQRLRTEDQSKNAAQRAEIIGLNRKIQDLTEEKDEMQRHSDATHAELAIFKEKLLEKQQQISAIEEEIRKVTAAHETEMQSMRKDRELDASALAEKTTQFNALIQTLETDLTEAKSHLAGSEDRVQELEQILTESKQLIKKLDEDFQEVKQEAAQKEIALQASIQGLEATVAELNAKINSTLAQLKSQTDQAAETSAQLVEITAQLEEAQINKEQNATRIHELQDEQEKLHAHASEQQREITELQETMQVLTAQNQQLTTDLDTQSTESNELRATLKETALLLTEKSREAEEISANLDQAQQEAARKEIELQASIQGLEATVAELTANINSTLSQLKSQTDQAAETSAQLVEITAQLEEAQINKEQNATRIRELQDEQEKLHSHASEQQREITELQETMQVLTAQNQQLTADLDTQSTESDELRATLKETALLLTEKSREAEEISANLDQAQQEAARKEIELQASIQGLEATVAELNAKINSTLAQLKSQTDQAAETSAQLVEITAQLEEAQINKEQNATRIHELQDEQEKLHAHASEQQREITKLQETMQVLTAQNQQLTADLDTQSTESNELRATLKETALLLTEKSREAEILNQRLETQKTEMASLQKELLDTQKTAQELESILNDVNAQIETADKKIQRATHEITSLQDKLRQNKIESEENLHNQSELRSRLQRSDNKNELLTKELFSLKKQYNNLEERKNDILSTLAMREREFVILQGQVEALREENLHLFTENEQLLDKDTELRSRLDSQNDLIRQLNQASDTLERILSEKDVEIFDLKSDISQRDERIKELEEACHTLQSGFKAQLANSKTIHDLDMLQDELDSTRRILTQTNTHVSNLEAENARLRALLAQDSKLGTVNRNKSNFISHPSPWPQRNHDLINGGEDGYESGSEFEEDTDEYIEVSNVWNPSLQQTKESAFSKRGQQHDQEEDITVTKSDGLTSDLTTSESDQDHNEGKTPGNNSATNNGIANPNNTPHTATRSRGVGSVNTHTSTSTSGSSVGSRNSAQNPRGTVPPVNTHTSTRASSVGSHSSARNPRGTVPPVNTSNVPTSSIGSGDVPVMTTSATQATVGMPRTIEDIHADINKAIGHPNAHYVNDIKGAPPASLSDVDKRFVLLSKVNPAQPTHPAKKLIRADLNEVVIYRRFTESTANATRQAEIALSALGIPPDKDKGHELPTELVINGKTDPDDPLFRDNGKNSRSVAIIKEMFRLHKVELEKQNDLDAGVRPSTPPHH